MSNESNPFDALTDGFDSQSSNRPVTSDEKTWATFAHLGFIAGFIIPFGGILTPLIIWLTQREKSEYVAYHAKESLNFQLSVLIYGIVCAILVIIFIGWIMLVALAVTYIVLSIMAAIKANEGVRYEYPLTIRIIR
ncbi:MAG: DUF4870 domain-containing protein [Bacteroidota bacterium]